MKRIYFKGLNEIRSLAALSVLFHHIELYKYRDNIESLYNTRFLNFISALGKNGVFVFFVLSGFLITYLLLAEKTKMQSINMKKFYIRRILRIWPLYYLVIFLSFLIVPYFSLNIAAFEKEKHYYSLILQLDNHFYPTLLLFLLFLPNLAVSLKKYVVGASQAWSVGVEEQFYLIWPQIIQRISKKYLIFFLLAISVLPYWSKLSKLIVPGSEKYIEIMATFFPIHFMAIGGVASYLLFYFPDKIQKIRNNKLLFFFNTLMLILFLFLPLNKIILGFIVALELLFVTEEKFKFNLRNKILDKIGKISYGVYMYHPLVMYFVFTFVHSVLDIQKEGIFYHIVIYFLVVAITLLISQFSYSYFEKKFVSYKNKKYTVIPSGQKEE